MRPTSYHELFYRKQQLWFTNKMEDLPKLYEELKIKINID